MGLMYTTEFLWHQWCHSISSWQFMAAHLFTFDFLVLPLLDVFDLFPNLFSFCQFINKQENLFRIESSGQSFIVSMAKITTLKS